MSSVLVMVCQAFGNGPGRGYTLFSEVHMGTAGSLLMGVKCSFPTEPVVVSAWLEGAWFMELK